MNKDIKFILYLVTIFLDFSIYFIWKIDGTYFTIGDIIFSSSVVSCHLPFYYALYFDNRKILDVLHVSIFVCNGLGIFVSNIKLLIMVLVFILGIQIQWITVNKCILNTDEQNQLQNFGFGKITYIVSLLYSCYLSYKLGRIVK